MLIGVFADAHADGLEYLPQKIIAALSTVDFAIHV